MNPITLSVITNLSTALGIPSALITISDKLRGWRGAGRDDPEQVHNELVRQFNDVQERALKRLEDQLGNTNLAARDLELLEELRRAPVREYFGAQEFGSALRAVETAQEQYKTDSRAKRLAQLYTGYFFEEMSDPEYALLADWYDHVAISGISSKCDQIREILGVCDENISNILTNVDEVRSSVNDVRSSVKEAGADARAARTAAANGERAARGIVRAFDGILLYLGLAVVGAGGVFLFSALLGVELEPLYMFAVPACILLSDLFICKFRRNRENPDDPYEFVRPGWKIGWKYQPKPLFARLADLFVAAVLQTAIATTLIYFISKVFAERQGGGIVLGNRSGDAIFAAFWIDALFLASLAVRALRRWAGRK